MIRCQDTWRICWECQRKSERCKAVTVNEHDRVEWVCRKCFERLDYPKFLYEYRLREVEDGKKG